MLETTDQNTLFEVLTKGGWVMLPLFLCSLAAVAVIVERSLWGPIRKRVVPAAFTKEVFNLIEHSRLEELVGLCRANNSPLSRIILSAVRKRGRPRTEIIEAVEMAGRSEAIALQRWLNTLGTVAAISPLLGLLGTVFGMITTFSVIKSHGIGDAPALAGGISEALVTTATGLTVAIPSLVFYRYFLQKSRKLTVEMENITLQVIDQLGLSREMIQESQEVPLTENTRQAL